MSAWALSLACWVWLGILGASPRETTTLDERVDNLVLRGQPPNREAVLRLVRERLGEAKRAGPEEKASLLQDALRFLLFSGDDEGTRSICLDGVEAFTGGRFLLAVDRFGLCQLLYSGSDEVQDAIQQYRSGLIPKAVEVKRAAGARETSEAYRSAYYALSRRDWTEALLALHRYQGSARPAAGDETRSKALRTATSHPQVAAYLKNNRDVRTEVRFTHNYNVWMVEFLGKGRKRGMASVSPDGTRLLELVLDRKPIPLRREGEILDQSPSGAHAFFQEEIAALERRLKARIAVEVDPSRRRDQLNEMIREIPATPERAAEKLEAYLYRFHSMSGEPWWQEAARSLRRAHSAMSAGRLAGETRRAWRAGDKEETRESLEEVLERTPKSPEARTLLSEMRPSLGPTAELEAQASYRRGLRAYLQGDLRQAAEEWRQAVQIQPEHEKSQKALARVLKELEASPP